MTNTIKTILFCGGRGKRLSEITQNKSPKGFIRFFDKPLISYQIKALSEVGLKHCIVTVNSESDKIIFNQFIKSGLIPKHLETISLISNPVPIKGYSHGFNVFRQEKIYKIIGNSNILLINADTVFLKKDLEILLENTLNPNIDAIVTTFTKSKTKSNRFEIKNGFITSIDDSIQESNITGVAYFSNKILQIFKNASKRTKPHLHTFIKQLLREKIKIKVIPLSYYINMNTIVEYNLVNKFIKQHDEW